MPNESTQKRRTTKPDKPRDDFPLTAHPNGQWSKKIRGKVYYFGTWGDPDGALGRYLEDKDDLYAGRKPRREQDGLKVVDLINRFLTTKSHDVESGELAQRSWNDYKATCSRVLDCFGRNRIVEDLRPDDFETLRKRLQKGRGLVTLGNEIQRVRTLFKYAWDADLIPTPVRFGPKFKRPSKKARRRQRNHHEPLAFSAKEIQGMMDAATPKVRAMVLLGINCGLGNNDVAQLPRSKLDLDGKWHSFGRPKTGVARRCPLWPETVEALNSVLAHRPEPKDQADANLVFLTREGRRYVRLKENGTWNDAISRGIGKLLQDLGFKRDGLNFYSLRRTFRTIGDEAGDQPAVRYIMGHADSDNDMDATYRQFISDDRLRAVTDHVHRWLFDDERAKDNLADAESDA